jgi:hypothetical protein
VIGLELTDLSFATVIYTDRWLSKMIRRYLHDWRVVSVIVLKHPIRNGGS